MTNIMTLFNKDEAVQIVDITPEIASELLERTNFDNRKLKPAVVKKYAKIMTDGDWRFSPETISMSKTGRLLNGQHRMTAVVQSGVTCRFLFATGFDDDVFSVLDRGATRTRADALKIDKKLSETAGLVVRLESFGQSGQVTDAEIYRAAMRIENVHGDLLDFCNTSAKVFSSAPFRLAAVARVMSGADRDYVFGLYRNLVLARTELLPPIGHAAIRASITGRLYGGGGHTQPANATVAWDVFNKSSAQKSKISVSYSQERAVEIVKATINE
jgi:hypothetical protein